MLLFVGGGELTISLTLQVCNCAPCEVYGHLPTLYFLFEVSSGENDNQLSQSTVVFMSIAL